MEPKRCSWKWCAHLERKSGCVYSLQRFLGATQHHLCLQCATDHCQRWCLALYLNPTENQRHTDYSTYYSFGDLFSLSMSIEWRIISKSLYFPFMSQQKILRQNLVARRSGWMFLSLSTLFWIIKGGNADANQINHWQSLAIKTNKIPAFSLVNNTLLNNCYPIDCVFTIRRDSDES